MPPTDGSPAPATGPPQTRTAFRSGWPGTPGRSRVAGTSEVITGAGCGAYEARAARTGARASRTWLISRANHGSPRCGYVELTCPLREFGGSEPASLARLRASRSRSQPAAHHGRLNRGGAPGVGEQAAHAIMASEQCVLPGGMRRDRGRRPCLAGSRLEESGRAGAGLLGQFLAWLPERGIRPSGPGRSRRAELGTLGVAVRQVSDIAGDATGRRAERPGAALSMRRSPRSPSRPAQASGVSATGRGLFAVYCLLSSVLATVVGAAVALPVTAGARLWVWALVTLALTGLAGLIWVRVAPTLRHHAHFLLLARAYLRGSTPR